MPGTPCLPCRCAGVAQAPAGVDGLPALQLGIHALQCRSTVNTDALGKAPDGVAVRYVHFVLQQAKALVAHAVVQRVFHLLVREVVQARQDENAHHHLGGIGRAPALAAICPCQKAIDQHSQFSEVDLLGGGLQRIAYLIDPSLARGFGEEVELQGAARSDPAVARAMAGDSGLSGWVLRDSQMGVASRLDIFHY